MILVVISVFVILFALTNPQINQYIAKHIFQDGKIFSYNEIQEKYPLVLTHHKRPIYVFFHICTQGQNWKNILTSQLQCLISSGLYDKCTTIWYGCSCNKCVLILKDYFTPYDKIKPLFNALCDEVNSYENITLNSMIRFCRELSFDADCLYIHTKGTSAKSESQHAWRDYMMHWMVKEHEISLDLLNIGFYTVGTIYQNMPITIIGFKRLYSGNFFWVNSNYMKSLPIISNINNPYEAEQLIFKNYTPGKHTSINKDVFFSIHIPWYTGLYKDRIDINPQLKENLEILIV
jgi:hypothetical protein